MCHLRTPRHRPSRVAGTLRANPEHSSSHLQGLRPEVGSRLQPTPTCCPFPNPPGPRLYLRSRGNPPRPLRSLAQSLRPEARPPKQPISARPLRAPPNDQKGRGRRWRGSAPRGCAHRACASPLATSGRGFRRAWGH